MNGKRGVRLEALLDWCDSTKDSSEVVSYLYLFMSSRKNQNKFKQFFESHLSSSTLFSLVRLFTLLTQSDDFANIFLTYATSDKLFDTLVTYTMSLTSQNFNKAEIHDVIKFYNVILCNFDLSISFYEKSFVILDMISDCMCQEDEIFDDSLLLRIVGLKSLIEKKIDISEKKPISYKNLEIHPNQFNIFENIPLEANQIEGPYKSPEQYLNLHFKLVRSDYFTALKNAVPTIKSKHKTYSPHFYIYRNVKSLLIDGYNRHCIKFSYKDEQFLKKEDWTTSKKFMNGSLLLFTQDDFETFFVGKVKKNQIAISEGHQVNLFISIIEKTNLLAVGKNYDMAEPRNFFEPYFQSLSVLQSMDPNMFPLAGYVLKLNKKPLPSKFSYNRKGFNFDETHLNESQIIAGNAALSQNLTLVQGPPGTGKSHLTIEIIKTLASDRTDPRPVLVVCMRNRSLDRLLVELAISGLSVVRFGYSESVPLQALSIHNWKNNCNVNNPSREYIINYIESFINNNKNVKKKEKCADLVIDIHEDFRKVSSSNQYEKHCYDKIKVMGATTTGAAKKNELISEIKPKAVIIEEAAEILEAYLISSLPKGCDHVILVGDHLQLRPLTSTYLFSEEYKMNVSLFERLILNGLPYHCLTIQHRMRPEISQLISPLFYDNLTDHPSVFDFPDIMGVGKNVYFIDHSASETYQDSSVSFTNAHEADFLLSFANYLLKQGYPARDIAILAAYSAQMNYLIEKSKHYRSLWGLIQIQTIDNYQGDENEIVLMSLVRSNSNSIGFLKQSNRINVALSRARKGLYIIGNANTLSNCCEIWTIVLASLRQSKSFGTFLPLKCKTHGNITKVRNWTEIDQLELGGCEEMCGLPLPCGHDCPSKCHPSLDVHETFPCDKPCNRKSCTLHLCRKMCSEPCGRCVEPKNVKLICGHDALIPCYQDIATYSCLEPCNRVNCPLHPCKRKCSEPCEPCKPRNVELSCGHIAELLCSEDIASIKCTQRCSRLPCGFHKCNRLCHEECQPCKKNRKIPLDCGHTVYLKCTSEEINYVCTKQCKRNACAYHRCENKCNEPCGPCKKSRDVKLDCGHTAKVPCSEDLATYRCLQPCERKACADHRCKKKCFEPCGPCLISKTVKLSCGHDATVPCSQDVSKYKCSWLCLKKICDYHRCGKLCYEPCDPCSLPVMFVSTKCGHIIHGVCGQEIPKCRQKCGKRLICSYLNSWSNPEHICQSLCHEGPCPPCKEEVITPAPCGHYVEHVCGDEPKCRALVFVKHPNCEHGIKVECRDKYWLRLSDKCLNCHNPSLLRFMAFYLLPLYILYLSYNKWSGL